MSDWLFKAVGNLKYYTPEKVVDFIKIRTILGNPIIDTQNRRERDGK